MNSILERVNAVCRQVREQSPNGINFKNLIGRTRNAFKLHNFDIAIKSKKDKTLDGDKWYIMAYYDAEDDFNSETPIEVIVHHNLDGTEQFGTHQITSFLIEIFDATVHEFRHQHQSIRRGHNEYVEHNEISPYADYLANQDELDAYAFSIAIELLRTLEPSRAKRNLSRISIMSKMRTGAVYTSPTLRAYIGHFGMSELTKKLAKKIYHHLETVDKRHIFM
jgi:hypothetical protein